MNYQNRWLQIKDFLKQYQNIWQNEIMLMYPDHLNEFPTDWIQELSTFRKEEDLIQIEKKNVYHLIKNQSLLSFYQKAQLLSELPFAPSLPQMPEESWTWLYITPKKKHEIQRLAPHINELYQRKSIQKIVDIGGGIGLLAQTLNNQYQHQVLTVDENDAFQKTGASRHELNAKDKNNKVEYKKLKVEQGGDFSRILTSQTMTIGLHTCGKLAVDQIVVSTEKKISALVNFGCCYHSLKKSFNDQNLSSFAKTNSPLWMNKFALTLSCRAHKKMNEKDFKFKQRVKFFRYAFHILLYDHYHLSIPVNLGNSHPTLYEKSFSTYALEQFKRIQLLPLHTSEELDHFFNTPQTTNAIEQMLTAGIIRNTLGRVLEVYLLLDRAMYLEEKGYKVKVESFFDEELSPRNIGITAERIN